MPRRKPTFDKTEIANLSLLKEQLSLNVLLQRVDKDDTTRKERSLEQKIIALKILVLNMMQYSLTAKQVGVDRKTLYSWWKQYGELIAQSKPEEIIAKAIETDMAVIQGESLKEAYRVIKKCLYKLNDLVDQTKGTRDIYALCEVIRVAVYIIKIERELNDAGKPKGLDIDIRMYNQMITNQYGKTD